ncbi:MAG: hypothetical protein NVS3B7_10720 [Candidatus Elarobacter sp.]
MRLTRSAWTALAALAVLMLYWLATSRRVYVGTLPHALLDRVFGEDDAGTVLTALRKAYSIVAFAVLGFVFDNALGPGRNRALRAALAVAAFSAAVEVGQKLHRASEGPVSNAVDIACGALGGWLGAVALPRLVRRLRAPRHG